MRYLAKLEKNKFFWIIISISFFFFLLRLPSIIEPNWYGDEGIYQVIGKSITDGRTLYTQIWDNKPPLLYLIYALVNGEQSSIKLVSLIVGIITVIAFSLLSKSIFKKQKSVILSTLLFAILFGSPIIEGNIANAENFILIFTISAGLLIYKMLPKGKLESSLQNGAKINIQKLRMAGFLLGIAFLFKIVAIFDFFAFFVFLCILDFPERFHISIQRIKKIYNSLIVPLFPLIIGFSIPFLLTVIYFISQNAFFEFIRGAFLTNIGYVELENKLVISQGLLILKLILLVISVYLIFKNRKQLSSSVIFILIWFVFSLFNTFFSGRAYPHYALCLLPSFCLLAGSILEADKNKIKSRFFILTTVTVLIINSAFPLQINKSFAYYGNVYNFLTGKKDVSTYQKFFDERTPRDYEIASYILTRTNESDNIFIWGDSAQIYALSNKIPPGRYTVAYHITHYPDALGETELALLQAQPKYIIILNEARSFPFSLPSYVNKINFMNSSIYEKVL